MKPFFADRGIFNRYAARKKAQIEERKEKR